MLATVRHQLHARSAALLLSIESGLPRIMTWWLGLAIAASALRIATSPLQGTMPDLATIMPYVLLTCAPLVSMGLALKWFAGGDRFAQPSVRLARVGRWTEVSPAEARRHKLYGTTGFMVSLLLGMLLNVPVRAAEYLAAMPALSGPVPQWLGALNFMLTLDVVLLSSLYVVTFVAALRRVPLFPRLLVAVWAIDLLMQSSIATIVMASPDVPSAVSTSLHNVLEGNVKKVLISVALWLPYLMLSRRVNVTFRSRVPA